LVEGVFYSRIKCLMNDFQAEVDARTSDAIALAVRFHCPIYVSETIMNQAGITESDEVEQEPERPVSEEELFIEIGKAHDFSNLAKTELEKLLEEAIRLEDYAKAAQIRDEINSRL
jgi:bifunctional DNase/RNase